MKYLDGYPELDLLSRALSFSSPSLRVSTRIEAYSCKAIKSERRLFKSLEHDLVSDLTLSTSISPPEHHSALVDSAFGPLDKKESRKTLWQLIATLNQAFPDHDFSRVSAEEFMKEDSARVVLSSLSSALSHLRSSNADPSYYRSFSSYPPAPSSSLPGYNRDKAGKGGSDGRKKGMSSGTSSLSHLKGIALHNKLRDLQYESEGEIPTHPFLRSVLDPIIDLGDCEVFSYTPDLDSDPHAYLSDEEEEEYTTEEDADLEDGDSKMVLDDWNANTGSMPSTPGSSSRQGSFRRPHRKRRGTHSRQSSSQGYMTRAVAETDGFMMDEDYDALDSVPSTPGLGGGPNGGNDETGGLLWSSNYFFYNKKMKRILFVSCWGRKLGHAAAPDVMIAQQKMRFSRPILGGSSNARSGVQGQEAAVASPSHHSLFARLGIPALELEGLGFGGSDKEDIESRQGFSVGSAPAAVSLQPPASYAASTQHNYLTGFVPPPSIIQQNNNPFRRVSISPAPVHIAVEVPESIPPATQSAETASSRPSTPARKTGYKRRASSGGASGRTGRKRNPARKSAG